MMPTEVESICLILLASTSLFLHAISQSIFLSSCPPVPCLQQLVRGAITKRCSSSSSSENNRRSRKSEFDSSLTRPTALDRVLQKKSNVELLLNYVADTFGSAICAWTWRSFGIFFTASMSSLETTFMRSSRIIRSLSCFATPRIA